MPRHDQLCDDPGCYACLREERDDLRAEVERLLGLVNDRNDAIQRCWEKKREAMAERDCLRAEVERLRALCREAAAAAEAWADEWSYYDEDYEHGVELARSLRAAGQEPGTDGGEG